MGVLAEVSCGAFSGLPVVSCEESAAEILANDGVGALLPPAGPESGEDQLSVSSRMVQSYAVFGDGVAQAGDAADAVLGGLSWVERGQ